MQAAVAQVNPVLRGWVNYFRVGNSGRAFDKVKYEVDRLHTTAPVPDPTAHSTSLSLC
jgi:hypothetical protein